MADTPSCPIFTLLTQTLPRRSQSSIRRNLVALGAKVHVATSNTDRLPNGTSHVLLTKQAACPVFVLAIASASTVRLVTPAFVEDCEKYKTLTPPHSDTHTPSYDSSSSVFLDASDILWIGRIWLGAYQYWRSWAHLGKCAPLYSHRILVVGQTRPRGAARLLSPSSAFVKDLIIAAGAQLLEQNQADASTFAIVAPGLNRSNSDVVATLLDSDVICFAPAFLLDLILRVAANPTDYLLFSSQKFLCAACLNSKSIFTQHPPLKVSTKYIEQPSSIPTIPKLGVAPALDPVPEISSRTKRSSVTSSRGCRPAKRKRPSQRAMTRQSNSIVPHRNDGSLETIDLTHSPRQDNLEVEPLECLHPSPVGSNVKKHPTTTLERSCSNDQNSPCRNSSELKSGIEIQPSFGGLTTSLENFGLGGMTKSEYPLNKVTEDVHHTSSGEVSPMSREIPHSPNMFPMRKEFETSFSLKDDSEHKAKEGQSVGELAQMLISNEAGSSQRDRSVSIGKNGKALHKSFQSTEQLGPSSCIANFNHTMPAKSYQMSGEHFGSGCRNGCLERSETKSVGQRERRGQVSYEKSLESRDWSIQPKRLSIASDTIGSEKLELQNSTAILKSTRTARRYATKSGSSSFNNQASNAPLTQPQRRQNKVGTPNYDFEPDFHLVMAALGGQPSEKTIKRMLKSIAAPKPLWVSVEQSSAEVDETVSCRSRAANSDGQTQRPQKFQDNLNGLHCASHGTPSWDGLHHGNHEIEFPSEQGRRAENEESLPSQVCVFSILPPKEPIAVRNVTRPEFVFSRNADSVDIVTGNENDDHVCQSSLSFVDWLIGTENFLGFVPTDALTSTQGVTNSLSRRVWLSLFEAKVFERLVIPGGLNDFQISILVGICARLVTCNFQPEMNVRVLSELLKLRELQKTSKMDSLTVVFSSQDPCSISYRHRAVATIWAMVMQSATMNSNTYCGWTLLEKGFQSWFEDAFKSSQQLRGLAYAHVFKKVNTFLEVLWIATLSFSLRTDLFGTEPQPSSGIESNMYPQNWNVFVHLFDRFQNMTLSIVPSSRHVLRQMLKTVLKFIADKYCEVLWQVNEEFLIACTRIVGRICKFENVSCFCEKITPHPEHFVDCSQPARSGLSKDFKTECEYLFYFSRNLVNHGIGNKMKHVMNIMRIASTFTTGEGADCESHLRKTRHYVSLVLCVADFVANSNGENQVCNVLTIKSEDFSILFDKKGVNCRENEQRWECILKGMVERCRASIKRCEGGHVYVKWMLSSVTEGLGLIKRTGERRAHGTGDKELLRAQESTLWAVTLKRFLGLKVILQLLINESGLETLSKNVSIDFLETILDGLSTLLGQLREWKDGSQVANVNLNSIEWEDLVHEIIEVAATMIKMVPIVLSTSRHSTGNYSQFFGKRFTDVFCEKNLNLILGLILGTNIMQHREHRVDCMEYFMGMLAVFINMFYANDCDGWNESGFSKLKEALRKSRLDFLSCSAPAYASDLLESESPNTSAIVQFWWTAITKLSWVQGAVRKDNHLKGVIVSVVLWIILQEGRLRRLENEKAVRMIKEVRCAIQSVEGVGLLFRKWKSYIELDDEETYNGTNAVCVQQAIEHSVKDWDRPAAINVVSHLRRGAHDMIRSKRENIVEDGLRIAGYLFNLECQAMGLCPAKRESWISERIADICDSVDFLRHSGGWRCRKSWDMACESMLESILSGLSMSRCSEQNVELRVVVLRLVNVVGDANDLSGVWGVTERRLLFAKGTNEDAEVILRGAIMENLGQWQEFILHGAVEDRLNCVSKGGQGRVLALRRLLNAARMGRHPKIESLVRAVVGRIQWNKRVEAAIRSDARSQPLWRQIVRQIE